MSGYGRFGAFLGKHPSHGLLTISRFVGGPEGLRSLTNTKAIMVDRWPWLMQTGIPAVLDYPVGSLVQSWYVLPAASGPCSRSEASSGHAKGLCSRIGHVFIRLQLAHESPRSCEDSQSDIEEKLRVFLGDDYRI